MMSLSLHRALQIFKALFAFSLIGIVISIILLLIHGRGDFVNAVASFGGNYDQVITDAHNGGYAGGAASTSRTRSWPCRWRSPPSATQS